MWELATHNSNVIFSICIVLVFMFGIIETLLLMFGGGSQGLLEQFMPDNLAIKDPDFSLDQPQGVLQQVLDWLYIGRLPLLIWIINFLTLYGLSGFLLQYILQNMTGHYFNAWFVAPLCLILIMPVVRLSARLLARILPKDETTAIYSEQLIGRTAVIILGDATPTLPAQAKVYDQFNQVHYILITPEDDLVLHQGETVLLTQQTKIGFLAIRDMPVIHYKNEN